MMTNKVGRPSLYTEELANEICERIANGESIRAICALDHMPEWNTIWRWKYEKPEFSAQYNRAREVCGYIYECDMDEVIRDVRNGVLDPHAARVMMTGIEWLAAVKSPKNHGKKVSQELSGPGGGPMQHQNQSKPDLSKLSDEKLAAIEGIIAEASNS